MIINKLLYLKLCFNRANSHLSIPLGIVDKVLLIVVTLKMFNVLNWYLISGIVAFLVFGFLIIGHIDIRKGVFAREQSLNNKYNPEIQVLLGKTKR